MKKVLIVSITFPPDSYVGSLRSGSFAKYLPSFGWMPITITRKFRDIEQVDICELSGLSKYGRVVRTASFPHPMQWYRGLKKLLGKRNRKAKRDEEITEKHSDSRFRNFIRKVINTFLYIPDQNWGWIPFAALCGIRLIKKEKIKIMYSTGPPWSSHLAALLIHALTGCHWIADFRDPWSRNPWRGLDTINSISGKIDALLEKLIVEHAKKIICVTEENGEDFKEFYPLHENRICVIHNGFDHEEFDEIKGTGGNTSIFTLTHLGDLYGRRDPMPLIEAIKRLVVKGLVAKQEILLRFVGNFDFDIERVTKTLTESGLDENVEILPRRSRREALGFLFSSEVLVLIQGDAHLQVPVKLYEYLGSGKPILVLAGRGATSSIIERETAGVVADPYDIGAIEKSVFRYYLKWSMGELINRDLKLFSRFDRKNLTGLLAKVLDEEIG